VRKEFKNLTALHNVAILFEEDREFLCPVSCAWREMNVFFFPQKRMTFMERKCDEMWEDGSENLGY
jgi:hypothetical protein